MRLPVSRHSRWCFVLCSGCLALALVSRPTRAQVPSVLNPLRPDETAPATESAPSADAASTPEQQGATSPPAAETTEEPVEVSLLEPMIKDQLQARSDRLDGLGLDQEQLDEARANYAQALNFRSKYKALRDQTKAWAKEVEARPEQIEALRSKPTSQPKPEELPDGLEKLDQAVLQLEQDVNSLRQQREAKETEKNRRTNRLTEIPKQIADAQTELRNIDEEINKYAAAPPTSDEVEASKLVALVSHRQMLQALIENLKQEQIYCSDTELLRLEADKIKRDLTAKEESLERARKERNRLQQVEADRQAAEAARVAEAARAPAIKAIAERNAKLTARSKELTAQLNDLNDELARRDAQVAALKQQFSSTRDRVENLGLTVSAGKLLLRQRKALPHPAELRRSASARAAEDDKAQFELYELQDERDHLDDIDARVASILAGARGQRINEVEIRRLLEDQQKYLDDLTDDYLTYSNTSNQLGVTEEALATLAEDYDEYVAERVLWIRSSSALGPKDVRPAIAAAQWSLSPQNWRDSGVELWMAFGRRPLQAALASLAILGLFALQSRARRRLREIGAVAEKRTCAEFMPSLRALAYTLEIALPWPALIWFIGWLLDQPEVQSDFVRSLAGATGVVARCLLVLEVIRALCRGNGLADAHFEWPDSCLSQVRRHVRWLTMVGLPLVLWVAGLELQETEPLYSSSLGRVCFIALMLLLVYRLYRMLMVRTSPFRSVLQTEGWWEPIEHLWRPLTVLLPLALAILAAVGYYYSAQQAAMRLVQTLVLMVVVLVVGGLTRRWLLTNRRALAREQAKQRRAQLAAAAAAAAAAAEGEGATSTPSTPSVAELVDETVDLAALSEQTQKLIRTSLAALAIGGMYLIWRELLPAVAYWGKETIPGFELQWSQLLAFVIVSAVTYVAVRDIPALLELAILQRLPLDSGSRYALATIIRYIIAGVGLSMAYASLGFTGDNIQWLVAAMGVGLGFGLQEIFANFVSGIILLFERPIRVGDIITLGEKTGAVSRIRMRATTIVDWDRKEYIVPNKDLMTERLLNWTLSDQTNRVVINVGVAYGSDTDRACELLLESARDVPAILEDPKPLATFEGFGDSSLNLTLRAYLPSLENRLATIHALHTTIDRKFRAGGIEIPFPQRDLNLRNLPAEWIAANPARSAAAADANGHASNGHSGDAAEQKSPENVGQDS
ncbi:MAG: hypothetical protein CMJ58_26145 [Planctomycetaceae bacterium]|nr:hypothetical protein [Planctomycetaceae bacterium]